MPVKTPNMLFKGMEARALLRQVLRTPPTVELADIDSETDHTPVGDQKVVVNDGFASITPVKVTRQGIVEVEAVEWSVDIMDALDSDVFRTEQVASFDMALDCIATAWMQDQLANIAFNRAEARALLQVEREQG